MANIGGGDNKLLPQVLIDFMNNFDYDFADLDKRHTVAFALQATVAQINFACYLVTIYDDDYQLGK